MEKQFGHSRYWTVFIEDRKDGFAGLRLHCESFGKIYIAAEVIYWDACGQFYVKTIEKDVPVDIIEALIAETKQVVKTK